MAIIAAKSKGRSTRIQKLGSTEKAVLNLVMVIVMVMVVMAVLYLVVVIGVMVMEVNKVADEVTDMEVDKVADMKNLLKT